MDLQLDDRGNPLLGQLSGDGFVDLTFRIADMVDVAPYLHLHLVSSHQGRTVAIDALVLKHIQGGLDEDVKLVAQHVYKRGVRLLRCGDESDHLISAIAELYGRAAQSMKMVKEECYTAIALEQGAIDIFHKPVRLKLFGNDGEPFLDERYYETFFNLDLPDGFVYWNEKDNDYREPLLKSLTAAD